MLLAATAATSPEVRLFVALWLPGHVVQELEGLTRPDRPGVRWIPPEQWHVTLRFLGEIDDPEPVGAALSDVAAWCPPARAVLGPQTVALRRHLLVAPVTGLDDLAAAVRSATRDLGQPPDDRPFSGHVTLARCRRGDARSLAGGALSASWAAREVAVVRSETRREGVRYETLLSAPMRG